MKEINYEELKRWPEDSYAFIELFTRLEDYGILIQPTRIDRNELRTVEGIERLIKEHK